MRRVSILAAAAALVCCLALPALAADKPLIFGLLLIGPYNDKGYSQAEYEGGKYVEEHLAGSKMLYLDKVNPSDRPGFTIPQLVDDLAAKGATQLVECGPGKVLAGLNKRCAEGVSTSNLNTPDAFAAARAALA